MGLLDMFRPRPPIRDVPALAAFIDENAAFLTQKGIYEYSRARAGHYAKVLFSEFRLSGSCGKRPLARLSARSRHGGGARRGRASQPRRR